ncbi:MAG: replication-relaxation family protein [Candidatus Bipolaricaulota bacterium]|nr:replication-relaxation family protein [Candidatus Bipolaricaulota bacterium]
MTNHRPKLKRPKPGEEAYKEPPSVKIQPRDIRIIDLVYKHRLLSSKQIYVLIDGSRTKLKRRLQKLWLNKYLERPPDQKVLRVRGDLRHLIYSLGQKGAEILAAEKGYDIAQLHWVQRSEVKFPFIAHNLEVSEFFTVLKLALDEKEAVKLSNWRQGKEIEARIDRPNYITARESRSNKPLLQPDGLFSLHYLPEDLKQYFYLEADRGTIREKTMLGRYKKYWAYWQQQGFTDQGIPADQGFRVLTVCKNETRARNLRQLIEGNRPWNGNTTMFWFTYDQWSIEEPEAILSSCWKTPKGEATHSLLD